jgi:hypothetical protein
VLRQRVAVRRWRRPGGGGRPGPRAPGGEYVLKRPLAARRLSQDDVALSGALRHALPAAHGQIFGGPHRLRQGAFAGPRPGAGPATAARARPGPAGARSRSAVRRALCAVHWSAAATRVRAPRWGRRSAGSGGGGEKRGWAPTGCDERRQRGRRRPRPARHLRRGPRPAQFRRSRPAAPAVVGGNRNDAVDDRRPKIRPAPRARGRPADGSATAARIGPVPSA